MGNEASTPIDDSVSPTTLKSRTLESVAKYILEKDIRKIVVLVSRHKLAKGKKSWLSCADRCRH